MRINLVLPTLLYCTIHLIGCFTVKAEAKSSVISQPNAPHREFSSQISNLKSDSVDRTLNVKHAQSTRQSAGIRKQLAFLGAGGQLTSQTNAPPEPYPGSQTDASTAYRDSVSNLTAPQLLRQLASPEKQVILVVFEIDPEQTALQAVKNWAHHTSKISSGRLLEHTLMIVPDTNSYDLCRAEGLPVYLDGAFPFQYWNSTPWYHEVYHGRNRYFDIAKHWWAWKITSLGYSVLYSDTDVVVLQDPLAYLIQQPAASYDLQAQSDSPGPEDPPPGFMLSQPCGIYKLVKEVMAVGGSQMREIWGFRGKDNETQLQAQAPCASTGFWYIRPSPVSIAFQTMLLDRILFSLPWGWEQVAFNEVIMAFSVGVGSLPPLNTRLFPLGDAANIGTWEARMEAGLAAKPLMVHLGGVNGAKEKATALARHAMWHPSKWDPRTLRSILSTESLSTVAVSVKGPRRQDWLWFILMISALLVFGPIFATKLMQRIRRRTFCKGAGTHAL